MLSYVSSLTHCKTYSLACLYRITWNAVIDWIMDSACGFFFSIFFHLFAFHAVVDVISVRKPAIICWKCSCWFYWVFLMCLTTIQKSDILKIYPFLLWRSQKFSVSHHILSCLRGQLCFLYFRFFSDPLGHCFIDARSTQGFHLKKKKLTWKEPE